MLGKRRGRFALAGAVVGIAVAAALGIYFGAVRGGGEAAQAMSGIAFAAPDAPLVGAHVKVLTLAGKSIEKHAGMYTAANGVWLAKAHALPARFVVEAKGGTIQGKPFTGRMLRLVSRDEVGAPVHLNPATTLVAAYALRHPELPLATVELRVKKHLGIKPWHSLSEGLRVSEQEFDGVSLLDEASTKGVENYISKLVDEIDAAKPGGHQFVDRTQRKLSSAAGDDAAADLAGALLSNVAKGAASKIGGALAGKMLDAVGLTSVSDFLGLNASTSKTSGQLTKVQQDLDEMQSQLTAIGGSLINISDGLNTIESSVASSAYTTMVTTIQSSATVPNVDSIGGTDLSGAAPTAAKGSDDPILNALAMVAADAATLTSAYNKVPLSAEADPVKWCTDNDQTKANPVVLDRLTACLQIISLRGTNVPPDGVGDLDTWCGNNASSLAKVANMTYWACQALEAAAAYTDRSKQGVGTAVTSLGNLLSATSGKDSLVAVWDKKLYAQISGSSTPFLMTGNFSVPQDTVLATWQAKLAILGVYTSLFDQVEQGDALKPCAYGSTSAQLSAAQCDLAKAGDYATRVLAATAKPDIPAGAAIYVPSTGGTAASPIREWSLVQQPGPCSQGWSTNGTITFGLGDGAWEWGFGSLDGDLVYRFGVPDCDLRTQIAVGSDKGDWKVPTAADLAALFSGHSQPGAWLTSALGFHDLSGTASLLPPPPDADVVKELAQTTTEKIGGGGKSNVPHTVTHPGYSTFTNPGTTYSVWTSECTDTGVRYPGFYAPSASSDPTQTDYLKAYFCTTVRLADGATSDLCLVTESPYHPCNWPVVSGGIPTVGSGCAQAVTKGDFAVAACSGRTSGRVALDYGHDAALLAWRAPSAEQYWYSP